MLSQKSTLWRLDNRSENDNNLYKKKIKKIKLKLIENNVRYVFRIKTK